MFLFLKKLVLETYSRFDVFLSPQVNFFAKDNLRYKQSFFTLKTVFELHSSWLQIYLLAILIDINWIQKLI